MHTFAIMMSGEDDIPLHLIPYRNVYNVIVVFGALRFNVYLLLVIGDNSKCDSRMYIKQSDLCS